MTSRARSALFAWLALAALRLALPGVSSTPDARADGAAAWVQPPHKLPPAAEGARTSLPDGTIRRVPATPFAPPAPFVLALSSVGTPASAPGASAGDADAPVVQPPARAPPALS